MNELETRLAELGARLAFPETPDLLAGVELAAPRRSRWPVRLALALVVAAAALGALLAASPGARSAFLELFHLEGATISRVDELPSARANPDWAPGRAVPLATAQASVDFRIRLPRARGDRQVRDVLLDERGGGIVSLVWCCDPTLVLTQFAGDGSSYVYKLASQTTTIDRVTVDGKPGYWIAGAPHIVMFRDPKGVFHDYELRVAGDTLLWVEGGVTLRLEGRLTKAEALELARSIR
jgi:hypothetical protein